MKHSIGNTCLIERPFITQPTTGMSLNSPSSRTWSIENSRLLEAVQQELMENPMLEEAFQRTFRRKSEAPPMAETRQSVAFEDADLDAQCGLGKLSGRFPKTWTKWAKEMKNPIIEQLIEAQLAFLEHEFFSTRDNKTWVYWVLSLV